MLAPASFAESAVLLLQLVKMAVPVFLSIAVTTALPMVTFLRVGRLGKVELAAAA
jgi:Na+-driven multidrug efflux pump